MDQRKTGRFIASCRREMGMTRTQLAVRLGVTNKAISKWETGKGMPDISIVRELCNILEIQVDEFLAGEHLVEEDIKGVTEEELIAALAIDRKTFRPAIIGACIYILLMIIDILIYKLPNFIYVPIAIAAIAMMGWGLYKNKGKIF